MPDPHADSALVTVLIDNYNYARFLPAAIDSALAQTHPRVEVLVVDDGSTDASREVLTGYGERIRTLLQANAGQATALQRGLAQAEGSIVLTLDSDDTLAPDTAARVAAVFAGDPQCVHVQYHLDVVDVDGRPTGATMPPRRIPLQDGDLRAQTMRVRGFRTAPTSGNAWSTAALRRLPPVPTDTYRQHVDRWWSDLISLLGTTHVLPGTAGSYRAHAVSHSTVERRELGYFTDRLRRREVLHAAARQVARDAGLGELPATPDGMQDAALRSWRLAAYKLGAPMPARALPALLARGVVDNLRQPDKTPRTRLAHAAWFAGLAVTPRGARAARMVQRRYARDD